jgi:hypothetical protein
MKQRCWLGSVLSIGLMAAGQPALAQAVSDDELPADQAGQPLITGPENPAGASAPGEAATVPSVDQPAALDPVRLAAAERLVQQLGSRRFAERDAAASGLLDLGQEAVVALSAATGSGDAEVRARAATLLHQLVSEDFETRLAAFNSAASGEASFGLPGWMYMRSRLSDEPVVRELFVGLCRRQPEFLQACEQPPAERQRAFDRLERQLARGMIELRKYPELPEVAGLLLLATDENVRPSETANSTITTLMQITPLNTIMSDQNAVGADARRRAIFAELAASWMRSAKEGQRRFAVQQAIRWELPIAAELAREHLKNAGDDLDLVTRCCQAIGRHGTIEDAPALAALLDDRRPLDLELAERDFQVQVRDVAAAGLLVLLGADLQQSGFPDAQTHPVFAFNEDTLASPAANDDARDVAIRAARERFEQSRGIDVDLQPVEPRS